MPTERHEMRIGSSMTAIDDVEGNIDNLGIFIASDAITRDEWKELFEKDICGDANLINALYEALPNRGKEIKNIDDLRALTLEFKNK